MKKLIFVVVGVLMIISSVTRNSVFASNGIIEMNNISYDSIDNFVSAMNQIGSKEKMNVKLLKDITIPSTYYLEIAADMDVEFDFAGFSIIKNDNSTKAPLENLGNLRIFDSSTTKSGLIRGENRCLNNQGKIIIDGGNFYTSSDKGGTAVRNEKNGTMTINDCNVKAGTFAFFNDGIATIHNGKFSNTSCSSCTTGWAYTFKSSGTLYLKNAQIDGVQGALAISKGYAEIDNGKFTAHECAIHGAKNAFYALYVAGEEGDVKCVVNGGEFSSKGKYSTALIGNDNVNGDGGINANATSEIRGGTFISTISTVPAIKGAPITGNPIISGGTFSSNPSEYLTDKYSYIKKDNLYSVYPKATKLTLSSINESIEVGKTKQLTATVEPASTLDKVDWSTSDRTIVSVDNTGKLLGLKEGKATIIATVGELKAECVVNVYKIDKPVIPDLPNTPVNEPTIGITKEKSKDIINQTSSKIIESLINNQKIEESVMTNAVQEKVLQAIQLGKTVTTEVESKTIAISEVKKEIIEKIHDELKRLESSNKSTVVVAEYLDLGILLKTSDETLGAIHRLESPITFTIAIPETLKEEGRKYYIVRVHNGETELLDTQTNEDGTLSFETDRFSMYALVYEENTHTPILPDVPTPTTKPDTPQPSLLIPENSQVEKPTGVVETNDSTSMMPLFNLMTMALFVGVRLSIKKRVSQ